MDGCIFCRIVAGEVPCERLAENERFLAFLDIEPISEGHALIIPKQHTTNFLDMPEYLGNAFIEFAQRVARGVTLGVGADGFNLGLNNGPSSGQVVFHTHFHIIPRRQGDGLASWQGHASTPEGLRRVRAAIAKTLQ